MIFPSARSSAASSSTARKFESVEGAEAIFSGCVQKCATPLDFTASFRMRRARKRVQEGATILRNPDRQFMKYPAGTACSADTSGFCSAGAEILNSLANDNNRDRSDGGKR